MVDSVSTMALETLRDLLIEEAKFLSSVSGQVEEVRRQLNTMHSFLKDADRRQDSYNSETVRDWIVKLRELSTQTENVLERYAIQVRSKRQAKDLKNKLKRFACILSECLSVHEIGNEIEDIRSRMADLTNKAETITKGESSSSTSLHDDQWSRKTYGHEVVEHFVGMKEDIERLESLLISDGRSNRVISICGMGGLGKTTLATKIYNREAVQRCFEARAWVCISQQFEPKAVFQGLLKQFLPAEKGQVMEMDEDELVMKLYDVQREKKCLVVLDDIWEADHWNSLSRAFCIAETRSKILLTSRNENIAATEKVYKLKCLSEDEGWELLQKIALPIHNSQELPSAELKPLEEIGRKMVRKCGYLPLPISVIGGILCHEKGWSKWEKVYKNIDLYLQHGEGVEENKRVRQVLDLSYNVLPYNLKPCFLYLGCFPEDKEIYTEQLYLLWMAEGMISSDDRGRGETLRDVAERYLCELANRCVVQVTMDERSVSNRFVRCRLHDLMRDLCLSKGKEEGFLEVVDMHTGGEYDSSVSRLAIHLNNVGDYIGEYQNLRSLLFLQRDQASRVWNNSISINFETFKYLKSLILENYLFQNRKLPKGIEILILLKNLSIIYSNVDELPPSVCKLPCLQSLDVRCFDMRLPNSLHKMRRLRHLFLYTSRSVVGGGKLKLNGLNELETLTGFNSSVDDITHLIKLVNLRQFEGHVYDEESLSMIVHHILNNQDQFREIRLTIWKECNINSKEGSILFKKVLMCNSLSFLHVYCRLCNLPGYRPQLCRNLTSLLLKDSYIGEESMEILEKLPKLRELYFDDDAFVGRVMVCRANGFLQLISLYLCNLPNLVEWIVEEKAMPNLSSIWISNCKNMKMMPEGLKFINTLKEVGIGFMPEEFKDRVRVVNGQTGEDYDKIKHVPSITIT